MQRNHLDWMRKKKLVKSVKFLQTVTAYRKADSAPTPKYERTRNNKRY